MANYNQKPYQLVDPWIGATPVYHTYPAPITTNTYPAPNTNMTITNGTTTWVPEVKPTRFRKSIWTKMMNEATSLPRKDLGNDVLPYYVSKGADALIGIYGNVNPVYRRKPKKTPFRMLNALNYINPRAHDYPLYHAGLFYVIPYIAGRQKKRLRLTLAGLKLLDHWAEKFPSFRPFLEAYADKKTRKEITSDCVDFEFGLVPKIIRDTEAKNIEAIARIQAEKMKLHEAACIVSTVAKTIHERELYPGYPLNNASKNKSVQERIYLRQEPDFDQTNLVYGWVRHNNETNTFMVSRDNADDFYLSADDVSYITTTSTEDAVQFIKDKYLK